jgi:hypothetical protein
MTALAKERNTKERFGEIEDHPVKAATKIWAGSLVVIDAGYAAPGRTATGLLVAGRAEETVDNSTGAAGDLKVRVKRGKFLWGNSAAGDLIAQANVGAVVYIVDDQTVALTSATSTRSAAGKVVAIDAAGVWVESKLVD